MTNKGLINQIPQAVSQAVQPLVEQAANDISSTLGSGNSSSTNFYQRPSGTLLTSLSNINDTPIQPRPGNNRPMLDNTGGKGGLIFDQYRNPGNMGRFISPSEMKARDPSYAYTPPTQLFAEGGMATQAQNLASRGRNGDTTLVHMTPDEVQGLQALAMAKGGSLTINPETGLPEANFLKSLLPTIAGVALSPFLGPMGAALAVGGIQALRTKDLGQGLMAGLGAYGGAGLGKSLGAMGAAPGVATQVAGQTAGQAAANAAAAGGTNALGIAGGSVNPALMGAKIAGSAAPANAYSAMATGAKQLIQPGGLTALRANMVGQLGKTGANVATAGGALGLANAAGVFDQPEYTPIAEEKSDYAGPYLPAERTARFRGRDAILGGGGREFQYFDDVNPFPNVRTAAQGGLMRMAKGGRYLEGNGDGTSDSIPAVIEGNQPARLADGEFVIDARTVSELGNGSSDAGARKLHALMEKVHARRKKAMRGKPSGADQYLKRLMPQTA